MDFALILDLTILGITLISCVVAFLRGFVREVLTILGLAGASAAALTAGPKLAPGIEDWLVQDIPEDKIDAAKLWDLIPYDIAAGFFAYVGLFVITLIVLSMISHWIANSLHAIGLGPVDRSLGVIFGLARAVVLIALLYLPFYILMTPSDKEEWFGESHGFSYVEYLSKEAVAFLPESWGEIRPRTDSDDDKDQELDPLKNLSGENDSVIGTDEDAAETQQQETKSSTGYDDIQRQAIETLIQNQEKIKDMIERPVNE